MIQRLLSVCSALLIWLAERAPGWLIYPVARQYIAGTTMEQAIEQARRLWEERGIYSTIDYLGEEPTSWPEVQAYEAEVRRLIMALSGCKYVYVSIKLTALGLRANRHECYQIALELVHLATAHGVFIRFDAEDATTTDDMHWMYRRIRGAHFSGLGIVMQTRLYRTSEDLEKLAKQYGGTLDVRLCIGIYQESPSIALQDKAEMKAVLLDLLRRYWALRRRPNFRIATHDHHVIMTALMLIGELNLSHSDVEFQWLMGVPDVHRVHHLIQGTGARLRFYVPYGPQWQAYSLRRFKNNPNLIGYIIMNLLSKLRFWR